ncbi:hypothetical protein E3J61_04230 [Candidatus Dependentiae bacterium]|nr:MAG: hypothetical protein E3J61_04230 [Candidatus Dependentiae bacterium]
MSNSKTLLRMLIALKCVLVYTRPLVMSRSVLEKTGVFMNKFVRSLFLIIVASMGTSLFAAKVKEIAVVAQKQCPSSYELVFDIPLSKDDSMYHEYLSFSVDHPDIAVESWETSIEPTDTYDPTFKKNKKIFTEPFSVTVKLNVKKSDITNAHLYVTYYLKSQKKITQKDFPLTFPSNAPPIEKNVEEQQAISAPPPAPITQKTTSPSWSSALSNLLKTTESWWVRFLLALLLGFLLSLTPCIYPMIPITVGILQSQGSKSVGRNLVLSLTYTLGIATTFALLGTMAAFSGQMFGNIMHNPWVVGFIVILIIYLAGSMIGLYELYIPSWLQPNNKTVKGGSLISVFMFGVASGTVASPCLSPGLLLLLTLITTLNNMLLGFGLMFVFGIGLGIPLVIIGTFSGSLNVLPRAGQWMVDVKQFFGFIMLVTAFYFLQAIVPWHILSASFWIFALVVGIFYLYQAQRATQKTYLFKNLIGIILVALSVYLFFYAYKTMSIHLDPCKQSALWLEDYEQACEIACKEKKKLLIDISAPFCSMCTAVNKKVLQCSAVTEKLNNVVPLHIGDIEATESTRALQKKYKVMGAPTILLIDPETKEEIKRWGSELYDADVEEFARELQ